MSTRDRIVEEATRQLTANGYDAFAVASVRDALGLSSGSMFHAFPTKAALAAEVYVESMRSYQQVAVDAIASSGEPSEAIRSWVATHLRWVEDHAEVARFLYADLPPDVAAAAREPLMDANAVFFTAASDLFHAAAAVGLMSDLALDVAHALVMGPPQEYCRKWTRGVTDVPPTAHIEVFCAAALAAMSATLPVRPKKRRTP